MSFVTRAFTPPGVGGAEAQGIMAAGAAQQSMAAAQTASVAPVPPPPELPTPPAPAQAPPQFATSTQATKMAQIASGTPTYLGAAAAAGQTAKSKVTLG